MPSSVAFQIGFVSGVIEGIVAFKKPSLAVFVGSSIQNTANAVFSSQPFDWGTFGGIVRDVAITTTLAGVLEFGISKNILTEWESFFIALDVDMAWEDTKGMIEFFTGLRI